MLKRPAICLPRPELASFLSVARNHLRKNRCRGPDRNPQTNAKRVSHEVSQFSAAIDVGLNEFDGAAEDQCEEDQPEQPARILAPKPTLSMLSAQTGNELMLERVTTASPI